MSFVAHCQSTKSGSDPVKDIKVGSASPKAERLIKRTKFPKGYRDEIKYFSDKFYEALYLQSLKKQSLMSAFLSNPDCDSLAESINNFCNNYNTNATTYRAQFYTSCDRYFEKKFISFRNTSKREAARKKRLTKNNIPSILPELPKSDTCLSEWQRYQANVCKDPCSEKISIEVLLDTFDILTRGKLGCKGVKIKISPTNYGKDVVVSLYVNNDETCFDGGSFKKAGYNEGEYDIPDWLKKYMNTFLRKLRALMLRQKLPQNSLRVNIVGVADSKPVSSFLVYKGYASKSIPDPLLVSPNDYKILKDYYNYSDCGDFPSKHYSFSASKKDPIGDNVRLAYLRAYGVQNEILSFYPKIVNKRIYTVSSPLGKKGGQFRRIEVYFLIKDAANKSTDIEDSNEPWLQRMNTCKKK